MLTETLTHEIAECVRTYQAAHADRTAWNAPLIAFADAHDPLFEHLRTVVRASHATPQDLLPDARTVITYFLPFHHEIIRSNQSGRLASREWAQAYVDTNAVIRAVNDHLAAMLAREGYSNAVLPPTHNFDQAELMSDWSHKHAAYIAGLGTFGLHRLLITEQGCCGRLGSLITSAEFPVTPRPAAEFCLHAYNGSCRACVRRCVNAAFTGDDFDRHQCYAMVLQNAQQHANLGLTDACGKCSCGVPCAVENPVGRLLNR